jgi:hypothetical protein
MTKKSHLRWLDVDLLGLSQILDRRPKEFIVYELIQGAAWFEGNNGELLQNWIPFLIHEFAHERVQGHLSEAYHRECCRLAGVLGRSLAEQPERFRITI